MPLGALVPSSPLRVATPPLLPSDELEEFGLNVSKGIRTLPDICGASDKALYGSGGDGRLRWGAAAVDLAPWQLGSQGRDGILHSRVKQ